MPPLTPKLEAMAKSYINDRWKEISQAINERPPLDGALYLSWLLTNFVVSLDEPVTPDDITRALLGGDIESMKKLTNLIEPARIPPGMVQIMRHTAALHGFKPIEQRLETIEYFLQKRQAALENMAAPRRWLWNFCEWIMLWLEPDFGWNEKHGKFINAQKGKKENHIYDDET